MNKSYRFVKFYISFVSIFLGMKMTAAKQSVPSEIISVTASPYILLMNEKVRQCLERINKENVGLVTNGNYVLKKGIHTITIKGREENSKLERLWIGAPGELPSDGHGISINIGSPTLIHSPMKLEKINNIETLIGGKKSGTAKYQFMIPKDGNYVLWGKGYGTKSDSNSFYVAVDGSPDVICDIPLNVKGKSQWKALAGRGFEFFSFMDFIFAWAAVSPNSNWHNDKSFRDIALRLTDASLKAMSRRPEELQNLWFLPHLEAVYLWQNDNRVSRQSVSRFMKEIRPYVEKCHRAITTFGTWEDNAPNIQLQAAAILKLASIIWKDQDPKFSTQWSKTADECLTRALKWKGKGIPFSYCHGSGTDAGYLSKEIKFLGRYYMLSGNKRAEDALKDMALFAENANRYGQPLSLGSPWWKHCFQEYNKANGMMISTLPLKLTENPQYAAVVKMDIQKHLSQPYSTELDDLTMYYNSLQSEIQAKCIPLEDKCFFSKIENGPFLRFGALNISMPYRSWCESTCGAYYSIPDAILSQVASIILTAVVKDKQGKTVNAYYPIAYSMIEKANPAPKARATIVAENFIASATVFRPTLGNFSTPKSANLKNHSPWERCDIYFADQNGYAGSLELKALRDNDCSRIALWVHCSSNLNVEENKINLDGLTINLDKKHANKIVNHGKIWGPPNAYYPLDLLERVIKESGENGFKKNDTFHSKVSVNISGGASLIVGNVSEREAVSRVEILINEKLKALLLFNRSGHEVLWKPLIQGAKIYQSSNTPGKCVEKQLLNGNLILPKDSLSALLLDCKVNL